MYNYFRNRSKDDCDIHGFSTELCDPCQKKSDPIAHNGKQNLLICCILLNLLVFLQGGKAYYELLPPIWVVDSPGALKVHHLFDLVVDNREFENCGLF